MEQVLMDKLEQGNLDEIDKDMIAARVKNATLKIMEEFAHSAARLDALFKEYSVEAKMAGISCIVLAQCEMFHKNDGKSDVVLVVGSAPSVFAMLEHQKESLKKDNK